MSIPKKIQAIAKRYRSQAQASNTIHITTGLYNRLPEHNQLALALIKKQGYKVQLTLNKQ
jgi:hypothetical protein